MKHTEYIVPIGEEAQDYDEMFIGVIRRQPEVVRCSDCKHYNGLLYTLCPQSGMNVIDGEESYCSWAERKEE